MTDPALVQNTKVLTVADIWQAVGDKVIARWEELGKMDSKVHWAYGAEADALIPEFPPMQVYKAIALKAGKSSETIKQAYYTFRAFDKATREKYHLVPYSIFRIAKSRPVEEREKVLEDYLSHPSVDAHEVKYPEEENPELEESFKSTNFPRMFYGIFREIWGIDPFLKQRALDAIKELHDIIKQVSK